jgi:4-amino-4-deoxy-L-arabinose transferase-like glycosyltransferase
MPRTSRRALLSLVVSIYCLLVFPRLLSYGMFVDGIVYASIARNMAENYGSFWRPYYTATVAPVFSDQPPLGFWLQSWAYRLFGNSVYIETLWGFMAGVLILVGLGCVWRCNTPQGGTLAGPWFPILLFVIIPMTSWILSNNMLENTMTVFIMASVYTCLLSLKSPRTSLFLFYGLLSGFSTLLAFLVKGPVALFTMAIPFLPKIKKEGNSAKTIGKKLYIAFVFLLLFTTMLLVNENSRYFFSQYVEKQIIASISGKREIQSSRLNILYTICRDIIVPLAFAGLFAVIMYRLRKTTRISINYSLLLYYLFIALVGSLPILISPKQMRWYAFPSFPFYALASATVFNDVAIAFEELIDKNKKLYKKILFFSVAIFFSSILLMIVGRNYVGRHKYFHNDFSIQSLNIEEREIISVYPENIETEWSLVANMQRKFKASLTKYYGNNYLLSTTEYKNSPYITSTYRFIHPEDPKKYILFKLND